MAAVPYSMRGSGLLMIAPQVRTVVNLSSYAKLAVRLANTGVLAPGEPDPLGTVAACNGALGDCLTGPVTRRDLDVLRYVRAELTAIFNAAAAGEDQAAMARMNALLLQFPVQPELVSHDDKRWHVHLAGHGSVADRFAAGAVIGVALTVSLLGVNRLGVCAIAACPRVFLDASPGKSRRYCSEHAPAKGNVSTLRRQSNGQPARTSTTGTRAAAPRDATPAAS
jgi:predicted RNA-binding Zn ribbon-like protein